MNDVTYVIYDHVSPSGKHYIGQTRQETKFRWGSNGCRYVEKRADGTYYHPAFAPAIKKYGWKNFEHLIVHSTTNKEECDYTEKYLIKWYKLHQQSYNLMDGGSDNWTTETMSALQNANKKAINQYSLNGEYIKTWSSIREAARTLQINRSGINSVISGRKPTAFNYQWRYYNGTTENIEPIVRKIRSVKQYTKSGEFVAQYASVAEASLMTNIHASSINGVCTGTNPNRHTAGGYKWRFAED